MLLASCWCSASLKRGGQANTNALNNLPMLRRTTGTAMHKLTAPILALTLCLPAATAWETSPSAEQNAPVGTPKSVTEGPVVDGRLDDDAWDGAPILKDFVQRERCEGTPVTERTEVRLLCDDEALYVGGVDVHGRRVLDRTWRSSARRIAYGYRCVFNSCRYLP